jgi:hypothetical protein
VRIPHFSTILAKIQNFIAQLRILKRLRTKKKKKRKAVISRYLVLDVKFGMVVWQCKIVGEIWSNPSARQNLANFSDK